MAKSAEEMEDAEKNIRTVQQVVDYTVREYPIEVLVQKHAEKLPRARTKFSFPNISVILFGTTGGKLDLSSPC
jgi:hypothetical protein